VTCAPVALSIGEVAELLLGAAKLTVFGKLKNSARKESVLSPGREKFLKIEASNWL
jgi:hypothetical protein